MQGRWSDGYDKEVFRSDLETFLPERIVDIHAHVWEKPSGNAVPEAPPTPSRVVSWATRVASENTLEQLMSIYRDIFPSRAVTPVLFSHVVPEGSLPEANAYVATAAANTRFPALRMSPPSMSADELATSLNGNPFCGIKVYLTYSPPEKSVDQIEIFDFLSREHLDIANSLGTMVMLHIPRNLRLRDPINVSQMMEIDRNYPNAKVVIAHVGRAYCPEDLGAAFDTLSQSKNLLFDISANTCTEAFEELLTGVGPERVLFGSDLPITTMRMRRICEDGHYINVVPRGLYGDVSNDSHMREVDGAEAAEMTLFLYEELLAFKRAIERLGLGEPGVRMVLQENAERLIASTPYGPLNW